eukprot:GEMP01098590.1.p2 GENE.GEMP01098590.1~~GEMP01098590.1.p2  ORF type:complete len:133 (+),score=29.58 GEMP01098590.1:30-428(+)
MTSLFNLTQPLNTRFHERPRSETTETMSKLATWHGGAVDTHPYLGGSLEQPSSPPKGYEPGIHSPLQVSHYTTAKAKLDQAQKLAAIPRKPQGAIAGYSGFIPRKEACNIIGNSYARGNAAACELFDQMWTA